MLIKPNSSAALIFLGESSINIDSSGLDFRLFKIILKALLSGLRTEVSGAQYNIEKYKYH